MNQLLLRCWRRIGYGRRGSDRSGDRLALEASCLTVRYPGSSRPAIREVTLAVEPGDCVALIGDNGTGKSTLLKAAAGLIAPTGGSVQVFGCVAGRCQTRVSYLPQRGDLAWNFPIDVYALVMTGRFVHLGWFRRPRQEDHRLVEKALDRLGIRDLARTQIGDLSGGQQQRLLLARTLVHEADLILLDEPLNGVDADTAEVVLDVMSGLARRGKAVLVATHDHARIHPRCDRTMRMQSGQLVEDAFSAVAQSRGDAAPHASTPATATEFVA